MESIKTNFYKIVCLLFSIFLISFQIIPINVQAATLTSKTPEDNVWVRAKLEYNMGTLKGVDDNSVVVDKTKWTKNDDWWYYKDPVNSGDTITFLQNVSLPTYWNNDDSEKDFNIIVTVECSEVVTGDTGWNENSPISYSQDFNVWNDSYKQNLKSNEFVKEGTITAEVKEYQLDENGKKVPYENDKIVTPGQKLDKIVEITIKGNKGGIIEVINRKTGDSSNLIIYIIFIVLGISAIYFVLGRRKKCYIKRD